jgi:predicted secreted protein
MLPFGLRTQDEDGEVVLGTVSSAPNRPHMLKVVIRTTIVTAVLYGIYLVLSRYFGLSFNDIPNVLPS